MSSMNEQRQIELATMAELSRNVATWHSGYEKNLVINRTGVMVGISSGPSLGWMCLMSHFGHQCNMKSRE
jgi:hypothetical protein